jgi:predicted RNA methylase
MHPLTTFFNYLKRINFRFALAREHIDERELTEWYSEWMYELMETDEVRTRAYRGAIEEALAGKVVLELGTGRKALLAMYCANAGATKVYAIEANKRAYQSSLEFVRSQGIENIHLICGFSYNVEIPERCDVLVHDLVGDIGSSEGMVPFVADARRRLLKPDAAHIPYRCTTYAVLAEDKNAASPFSMWRRSGGFDSP